MQSINLLKVFMYKIWSCLFRVSFDNFHKMEKQKIRFYPIEWSGCCNRAYQIHLSFNIMKLWFWLFCSSRQGDPKKERHKKPPSSWQDDNKNNRKKHGSFYSFEQRKSKWKKRTREMIEAKEQKKTSNNNNNKMRETIINQIGQPYVVHTSNG